MYYLVSQMSIFDKVVIYNIFKHLDLQTNINLLQVNKSFNAVGKIFLEEAKFNSDWLSKQMFGIQDQSHQLEEKQKACLFMRKRLRGFMYDLAFGPKVKCKNRGHISKFCPM